MTEPPLPPESPTAPPPRPPPRDPPAARRAARWAGASAVLTVSVLAAAPGGVLSFLVLVAGGGIFLALTRRAAVLGMSRERIPDSMVLGCFMTVGVAALVLFGVCLVGSTGSSSSGTGSGVTSPADTASVLDTASVFDTAPAPDSTPAPDTASAPTPR